MLASNAPAPFQLVFGQNAVGSDIRTVPNASQIGIQNGAASFNDGFPPLVFLQVSAGGTYIFGQDLNGLFKQITSPIQFIQAGGIPQYNSTFSTAIGGYPNGAVLQMASGLGFWQSTVDNNASDPDTGGANWKVCNAQLYAVNNWTAAQSGAIVPVQPALPSGTLTLNFALGNNFVVGAGTGVTSAITGNFILGSPTNQVPGQSGIITFVQDGTGGHTITSRSSVWIGNNGARVNLTAGANGQDDFFYITRYDGRITLSGAGNVS